MSGGYKAFNKYKNLSQQMFIQYLLWAKDFVIVWMWVGERVTMVIKNRVADFMEFTIWMRRQILNIKKLQPW